MEERQNAPENEGVRLNKYLSARAGVSRREADRMIADGRVAVQTADGRTAAGPGRIVFPGERVFLDGEELGAEKEKVYLLYHKPCGVICTSDRSVKENILDAIGYGEYVTYAGRLDRESSGLMLMTNDGALIEQLMRGANVHEKEYRVEVDRPLTKDFLKQMRLGVEIELPDGERTVTRRTRPCRVIRGGERSFTIILTQGWNRQIRRMCSALGYRVLSITRTRIENLVLGGLEEGQWRHLTKEELETLRCGTA